MLAQELLRVLAALPDARLAVIDPRARFVQHAHRDAHVALDLLARHERRDRVDDDDVHGTRAHERVGDLERLLAVVRLRDEQIVGADPAGAGPPCVERVLGVDEGGRAAGLLRRGDDVEREGGLAGRLRAVDLDDPAARKAAHTKGHVDCERARRDDIDLLAGVRAELHDRALTELLLDLLDRLLDRSGFLCYSHLLLLSAPKKSGAGLLYTGAAPLSSVFSGVAHQFSFSLRFGFTISKVMGWTGCATPFPFRSFSSCPLASFFFFLPSASLRPGA